MYPLYLTLVHAVSCYCYIFMYINGVGVWIRVSSITICVSKMLVHMHCIKLLLYWDWQAIDTDFYGIHVIHDFMFCFSLYAYNHACLYCSAAIYCWLSMYCLYIVILLCFKMQIFSNQQEKTKCQSWFK